jgi:hypothetical protein
MDTYYVKVQLYLSNSIIFSTKTEFMKSNVMVTSYADECDITISSASSSCEEVIQYVQFVFTFLTSSSSSSENILLCRSLFLTSEIKLDFIVPFILQSIPIFEKVINFVLILQQQFNILAKVILKFKFRNIYICVM